MIQIIPYQARWPAEFERLACLLRDALGPLALRIDHIGSTSVPGLAAKDVIDVQISVATLSDDVVAALTPHGFIHRPGLSDHKPPGFVGSDEEWAKLYFKNPPDTRAANIHVRAAGRANQRYALLFRDYLRAHPEAAAAYAELKRRLAANLTDIATYADTKDPACDLIMMAAEAWNGESRDVKRG